MSAQNEDNPEDSLSEKETALYLAKAWADLLSPAGVTLTPADETMLAHLQAALEVGEMNYSALGDALKYHRSTAQRAIKSLLDRLAKARGMIPKGSTITRENIRDVFIAYGARASRWRK